MIKIGSKNYYTPQRFAEVKMVSVQTVYNWIKDKKVKTTKLMDKTLIEF